MDCIVTAGPTYEPLDEVRRLTNFSTGTLGTRLAERLALAGHRVLLLRGSLATSPPPADRRVEVEAFSTTDDLAQRLQTRASPGKLAIFHAAAVSDFAFGKILQQAPDGSMERLNEKKVSTREGNLYVELRPTVKILPRLRGRFPGGRIVGWKYEVDGDRSTVLARGERQIRECNTDACVINGPAYGRGYGWVKPGFPVEHLEDTAKLGDWVASWI